jgi:hypothetical protein
MDYKSMLSDAQIAELLGIELKGGLQDLSALTRIDEFRENFESALEKELAEAERDEMLRIVWILSHNSIQNELKKISSGKKLNYSPYGESQISIIEQRDDYICIAIILRIYAGKKSSSYSIDGRISRDDAKTIRDDLNKLKRVGLESVNGLYLEREGYSRIESLTSPVKLSSGDLLDYTHLVVARYVLNIPGALLPKIYTEHKHLS